MVNEEWFKEGWLNLAAKAYAGKSKFDFGKIYKKIGSKYVDIDLSIIDMRAFNKGYSTSSIYFKVI